MKLIRKDKGAGTSQADEKTDRSGDEFRESGKSHRARDSYFKALRRLSRKRATIVRIPMGELQQRFDWSVGRGSGITETVAKSSPNGVAVPEPKLNAPKEPAEATSKVPDPDRE